MIFSLKAALCAMALIASAPLGLYLAGTKTKKSATPTAHQGRYQPKAVYLNTPGDTAVIFSERMGIGRVDNTPGLDPFRMQGWSEPLTDCSNQSFHCVSAGNLVIFTPVAPPLPGRTYRYRGRYLRVFDCVGRERLCTFEIGQDPQRTPRGAGNPPMLIYLAKGNRGVLSLGFSEIPDDPHVTSQQYRLRGRIGLFGSP
jgi:hypothetical protein